MTGDDVGCQFMAQRWWTKDQKTSAVCISFGPKLFVWPQRVAEAAVTNLVCFAACLSESGPD